MEYLTPAEYTQYPGRVLFALLHYRTPRRSGITKKYQLPLGWEKVKDLRYIVHGGKLFIFRDCVGSVANFLEIDPTAVFFNPAE